MAFDLARVAVGHRTLGCLTWDGLQQRCGAEGWNGGCADHGLRVPIWYCKDKQKVGNFQIFPTFFYFLPFPSPYPSPYPSLANALLQNVLSQKASKFYQSNLLCSYFCFLAFMDDLYPNYLLRQSFHKYNDQPNVLCFCVKFGRLDF